MGALCALGLLTFWLALPAQFVNFDDDLFFGPNNPEFTSAYDDGELGLVLSPGSTIANAYLPVAHLSLFVDYALGRMFGGASTIAHAHSLLLHVLGAWLLARLLGRLGLSRGPATAAAALFMVHPALAESVAWVSSRKDLLSGLFSFLCLSAVARAATGGPRGAIWMAAVWAALAMYSKATAVVLVALAPIVVWLVRGDRRSWGSVVAVGAVVAAATWHHASIAAAQGTMQAGATGDRALGIPGAYLHYLGTLVWPAGLNVLYPEVKTLEAFQRQLLPGMLVLTLLAIAPLAAWRLRRPRVAAGLAMACVALVPFNTAWPASSIAAADRYLYLVVPWAALALVSLPRSPAVATAVGLLAALPLASVAHQRTDDFRRSTTLWESSLQQDIENAVAELNLAQAVWRQDAPRARSLAERAVGHARYPEHRYRAQAFLRDLALYEGRVEDAIAHARATAEAAEALPDSPAAIALRLESWLQLSSHLLAAEDDAAARTALDAARAVQPAHPAVLAFEAKLLLDRTADAGRVSADDPASERARDLLDAALGADPDHFEANFVRGLWARAWGQRLPALKYFRRARGIAPARAETYLSETDLFLEAGEFVAAETAARAGIAAGGDDPRLAMRLGMALTGRGLLDDAQGYYESCLEVRPDDVAVQRLLAEVLATKTLHDMYQLGPDELDAAANRIAALDPANLRVPLLRGTAARLRRDLATAVTALEEAYRALPYDEEALRLLAETHRDRAYQLLSTEDPPNQALDHFRRFVDLAAPGVDTSTALRILRLHWQKSEDAGVAAFQARDFAVAEASFRRCLSLLPDQHTAFLQLGLALLEQGATRHGEALQSFEQAERGQRDEGLDPSMPVLYQVITLRRMGRADEATARGNLFLRDAAEVPEDMAARIRAAIGGED